jgi:hypothetical protein
MNRFVVLLLGKDDEYLGNKQFKDYYEVEDFVASLHQLMMANIEGELPLKERLKLRNGYFPFAGRIQDVEIIAIEQGDIYE